MDISKILKESHFDDSCQMLFLISHCARGSEMQDFIKEKVLQGRFTNNTYLNLPNI